MRPIPAAYETDDIQGKGQIRCLSMGGLLISCKDLPAIEDFVRLDFQNLDDQRIELCVNVVSLRPREGQLSKGESGFVMRVDAGMDTYLEFYHQILTAR